MKSGQKKESTTCKSQEEEDGFWSGNRGLQEQSCCFGGLLTVNSQEEEDGFRAGDRGLQEQSCCFGGLLTLLLFLCPPCMSSTVPPRALPSCCLHCPLAASPALPSTAFCYPLLPSVLLCWPLLPSTALHCLLLPSASFCCPLLHPIF